MKRPPGFSFEMRAEAARMANGLLKLLRKRERHPGWKPPKREPVSVEASNFLKTVLGGRAQRKRRYAEVFGEMAGQFRRTLRTDTELFNILFRNKIGIPAEREIFRNTELMDRLSVRESHRKIALRLLDLEWKTSDLAVRGPSLGPTVDAKEMINFVDFALTGVRTSMESTRGTPEYRENLDHYTRYIKLFEDERKRLESIEGGKVKRSDLSLDGLTIWFRLARGALATF